MVNIDASTLMGLAAVLNAVAAVIGAIKGWRR